MSSQGSLDNLNKNQTKNLEERIDFPDKGNSNKIVLMVVDPSTLFAYYSFSDETKTKLGAGEIEGILEIHDNNGIKLIYPIKFESCNNTQKNFRFKGLASNTDYQVTLKIPKIDLLLESKYVTTPRNFVSDDLSYTEMEHKY